MKTLPEIATDIYENEFGSDDSYNTEERIQSWLESNLGQLNALIYTCYEGADAELTLEAADIYKQLYLWRFYSDAGRNALRGILTGAESSILSVKEGDTTIVKTNKSEVAKTYRSMSSDYKAHLDTLVGRYHVYQANPLQVTGEDDL